jgi:uncharacterized protein
MQPKTQILIVNGGMTFKSKKDYINFLQNREVSIEKKVYWTDEFMKQSLSQDFDIIKPRMPLQDNAKYNEWKIHFEKYIPYLQDNLILIGQSLGGIFLAKYLSENKFPKKILSTFLIAPPYDNTLPGEDLVGGFRLKSDLSLLEKNSKNLYLMFSKDDETVPISHAKKFQEKLKSANFIIYESKNGHFRIPEFPEIVELIKRDTENML